MPLHFSSPTEFHWNVRKTAVVGPGIVVMSMAALLAHSEIREGIEVPAKVVVVQRDSRTSRWNGAAINAGESVIGGIERALDSIVASSVGKALLRHRVSHRRTGRTWRGAHFRWILAAACPHSSGGQVISLLAKAKWAAAL